MKSYKALILVLAVLALALQSCQMSPSSSVPVRVDGLGSAKALLAPSNAASPLPILSLDTASTVSSLPFLARDGSVTDFKTLDVLHVLPDFLIIKGPGWNDGELFPCGLMLAKISTGELFSLAPESALKGCGHIETEDFKVLGGSLWIYQVGNKLSEPGPLHRKYIFADINGKIVYRIGYRVSGEANDGNSIWSFDCTELIELDTATLTQKVLSRDSYDEVSGLQTNLGDYVRYPDGSTRYEVRVSGPQINSTFLYRIDPNGVVQWSQGSDTGALICSTFIDHMDSDLYYMDGSQIRRWNSDGTSSLIQTLPAAGNIIISDGHGYVLIDGPCYYHFLDTSGFISDSNPVPIAISGNTIGIVRKLCAAGPLIGMRCTLGQSTSDSFVITDTSARTSFTASLPAGLFPMDFSSDGTAFIISLFNPLDFSTYLLRVTGDGQQVLQPISAIFRDFTAGQATQIIRLR